MSFVGRILLIVAILGAVGAWYGFKEFRLAGAASQTPKTISCKDLEANGPGENAHVNVTDFLLCPNGFVYQSQKNSTRWSKIWVPAVPLDGVFVEQLRKSMSADGKLPSNIPAPKNVRIIIKTANVHNESELDSFADKETLQGLVVNKVESLGSEEKKILSQSYPGIDFSTCWIVEEGRKPKSRGAAAGILAGGGAGVLVGLFGMLRRAGQG